MHYDMKLVHLIITLYILVKIGICILTEYALHGDGKIGRFGKKTRIPRIIIYILIAVVP